jgi:phage shock protein PspC (stress-responsive transcriptional regulator)
MKRLYRSKRNKVIAGICGGVGEYLDIDPVIVRILAVILTPFTGGLTILVYIVSVFVIPPEPLYGTDSTTPAEHGSGPAAEPQPKPTPNMEDHVRILSILYIVFSALGLIIAAIVFVAVTGGGLISGDETAIMVTTIVGTSVAGLILLLSAPGIIGGIGLMKKQSWARILVLVLGVINLINIPFGTALGIYTIWTLTNKETEKLFK